jgi:NitT/TauT family transport system substrate-binding protein
MKIIIKIALLACVIAMLVSSHCIWCAPINVTIGTWKTQQTITPFLYQRFLPDGSKVDVRPFTNPGDQKTALLAGSLDMCGTTIVQAIICAAKGEPVVLVAPMTNKCSALVVRKDSDIHKPADLKGKRIGYVPNTMHYILLLEVLAKAGLKPSDVQLMRVDFFDMKTALAAKQIDAFLSGEPYPTIAVADGTGRILAYPYLRSIGTINSGMLITKKMIENQPKKVQTLVTAHLEATMYLQNNPKAWISEASKFGTNPEILRKAAKNIELHCDFDKKYIDNARNLAARMLELGIIDNIPNMDTLFNTRFLKEAKKELANR